MRASQIIILVALALVLGIPWLVRPPSAEIPPGARTLIVLTPHNDQIRSEFARAFRAWHEREYGEPVVIDWRTPGGTSVIRRQLESEFRAALEQGRIAPDEPTPPGTMSADLFFGGGSYDHTQVKNGVSFVPEGADEAISVTMSEPIGLSEDELRAVYGDENLIGAAVVYDPEQHWLGTALSGFGIVYNRDVLDSLGLSDPSSWNDLTAPEYSGWLALADPRHSGSVETTYDSILNNFGWDEGWRILRAMSANARYFANSATKPPIDVARGEAAAGVAIDFYGRFQAQAMMREGETPETARVGYVDPPGVTFIDPDPVTLLRGAPHPELARRFIRFVLSVEGQALWQLPAREGLAEEVPGDGLGPLQHELRRMPVHRAFYEPPLFDRLIDRVDPYQTASTVGYKGWRSAIKPMMSSFGIDSHERLVVAWRALHSEAGRALRPERRAELMDRLFAMPTHTMLDGTTLPFDEQNYRAIRGDWRERERIGRMGETLIEYQHFFRDLYDGIVEEVRNPGAASL
ncbi:MAG: ABC transporter substrate-binding protein [Phycisphaerales bacterium]